MNDIERAIEYMAEAIKETDEDFSECSGRLKEELAEQRQHFEIAIQALEAQIPKKPAKIGGTTLTCPACVNCLPFGQQYCECCGQKMDWSDEDE